MPNPPQAMQPSGALGRVFGWAMDLLNRSEHRHVLTALQPASGEHVLEIGFGTGQLLCLLAETPQIHLAGVDPSVLMVETALRRVRRCGKDADLSFFDLRVGTASALPWDRNCFDKVAALHCFQFWEDPDRALREIARCLKPDGLLVLTLRLHGGRAPAWIPNPLSHTSNEVEAASDALRRAGFTHVEVSNRGSRSPSLVARAT